MPDSLGFYQPITLSLTVPDGPPEYKAGWHAGCKTGLANRAFANAFVYQGSKGPGFGNGVYQHDPAFQTGWGQAYIACTTHVAGFIEERAFKFGPLE